MKKLLIGLFTLSCASTFAQSTEGLFDNIGWVSGANVLTLDISEYGKYHETKVLEENCATKVSKSIERIKSFDGVVISVEDCKVKYSHKGSNAASVEAKIRFIR